MTDIHEQTDQPIVDLGEGAVLHLGLGARATPLHDFTWDPAYLQSYMERFASDGDEGRLVGLFHQTESWSSWECHPAGEEIVLLLSGRADPPPADRRRGAPHRPPAGPSRGQPDRRLAHRRRARARRRPHHHPGPGHRPASLGERSSLSRPAGPRRSRSRCPRSAGSRSPRSWPRRAARGTSTRCARGRR